MVDVGTTISRFLELSDITTIAGGNNDDIVTVVVPGVPQAGAFTNLSVDIEILEVDNTGNNSTDGTAWELKDGVLAAENATTGTDRVDVLSTAGAESLHLLAPDVATADLLTVATDTSTDVVGRVDGNRVELEFGNLILFPGELTTFDQAQITMDFDDLLQNAASITQQGLTLTTDSSFVARDGALATSGTGIISLSLENGETL